MQHKRSLEETIELWLEITTKSSGEISYLPNIKKIVNTVCHDGDSDQMFILYSNLQKIIDIITSANRSPQTIIFTQTLERYSKKIIESLNKRHSSI